jgi:hypothetical protein
VNRRSMFKLIGDEKWYEPRVGFKQFDFK